MSVIKPNDIAENEAVNAKLHSLVERAKQQPCNYRVLFDEALILAEKQFMRAMAAEGHIASLQPQQ